VKVTNRFKGLDRIDRVPEERWMEVRDGQTGDGRSEHRHSRNQRTKMDEFNSNDHYIYYCGQQSLRRNGVALIINRESEMQYLDAISKTTEWSLFVSKANHSISG